MAPDPRSHLALGQLLQELKHNPKLGIEPQALEGLSHRRVCSAALDAKIPADRINGRWYVKRSDLRRIAELLGVLPKPRIGRPPRRTASVPSNAAVA